MTDKATDKREPGFFQIDNELVENYHLTPYSAWLYCVIVKHAGKSTEAFPSIKTLATLANMSKPTVIKNLAELEKRNLITVKREKINSKQNAVNHYFVQDVVKNADLEYIEVVSQINQGGGKGGLPGVVKEVDRNKTQENKIKEKDSQPKVGGVCDFSALDNCSTCGGELEYNTPNNFDEVLDPPKDNLYKIHCPNCDTGKVPVTDMGQGDTCAKCGKTPLPLFEEKNNEKHMVCNCTTEKDMDNAGFVPMTELELSAMILHIESCPTCNEVIPLCTCGDPFADKNHSDTPAPPRVIQDDDGHFVAGPVKIYTPTPRQPISLTDLENTCPECNEIIHDGSCLCDLYGSRTVDINWQSPKKYTGEMFCPTCEGGYKFVRNPQADSIDGICYCDGVMRWQYEEMSNIPQSYWALFRSLVNTDPEWLKERKRRLSTPTLEPFADKNLPGATVTPLIPDESAGQGETCDGCRRLESNGICSYSSSLNPEYPINKNRTRCEMYNTEPFELPPNDGRKVGRKPDIDPAITEAIPPNVIPRKERLVLPEETEPEAKKPKKKPYFSRKQREPMNNAIIAALGWDSKDVSWSYINATTTELLTMEVDPALLSDWQTWNDAKTHGKVSSANGIIKSWGNFMKERRKQPTHKPTPELDIQVEEEYQ